MEVFGQTLVDEDPDGNSIPVTVNIRFPGQYFDSESGLHYNLMRDYDPAIGRYVESDPIGLNGGINTYAYVQNRAMNRIDVRGLCGCEPGKGRYSTQSAAARAQTRRANPLSIKLNLELCGNICKDKKTGKYFGMGAIVGTIDGCNPKLAPQCTGDCSYWVAVWHTHGAYTDNNNDGVDDYGSDKFSGEGSPPGLGGDLDWGDANNVDVYVGTPGGGFRHYPHDSRSPYPRGKL